MKKPTSKHLLCIILILLIALPLTFVGNFLGWFDFGNTSNIESNPSLFSEILGNIIGIMASLITGGIAVFLLILPILIIIYIYRKLKYNHYKNKQDKETELQLLKEHNELLKQLVNNKGE